MPRFSEDRASLFFSFFFLSMDGVVSLGCPSSGLNKSQSRKACSKNTHKTVVGVFVRIRELVRRVETKGRRFSIMQQLGKEENGWALDPCQPCAGAGRRTNRHPTDGAMEAGQWGGRGCSRQERCQVVTDHSVDRFKVIDAPTMTASFSFGTTIRAISGSQRTHSTMYVCM